MKNSVLKTIGSFILTFCTLHSFSQTEFYAFGGPQVTSAKYKVAGKSQPTDYNYGFQLGAGLKVPFEGNLYFAPSVYYSMKGYKVTLNQSSAIPASGAINNDTRIHTIEVAPLLQYDFSAKPSHFFVKGGVALDGALSGKEKFELASHEEVSRKMKFSFADYGYVTASANVHLGFESAKGLLIYAHYAHGIGSLCNKDNGPKIYHRVAGISIGYYFRRNHKL